MQIQSVLIPRKYTYNKAKKWIHDHGYTIGRVDVTEKYYRFRQMSPKLFTKYITKYLTEDIEAVIGLH